MNIRDLIFYQCKGAKSKLLFILILNFISLFSINAFSYTELGTINRLAVDASNDANNQGFSYGLKTSYMFVINSYWRIGPSLLIESESARRQIENTYIQYNSKTAALGISQQIFYINFDGDKFLTFNADLYAGLTRTQVTYDQKTSTSFSETTMRDVNSATFYALIGPAIKFKSSLLVGIGSFFRQDNNQSKASSVASRIEIVDGTHLNLTSTNSDSIKLSPRQDFGIYLNLTYRFHAL